MRQNIASGSALLIGSLLLVACGGSVPQPRPAGSQGERPSPLGQSYTLSPLPSDDESLLGRVLDRAPAAGQSLEEVARPNPCADKLTEAKTVPSVATFDDAEELAVGGKASATLGTYGFSGDASRATHFVYKLETEKRASRVDTAEYEACCKEKSCGYGFVSALVYGSGEYATAEETSGSAGVSVILVAKVEGTAALRVLHKRSVKGWVAALIRVTDQSKAPGATVGALGDPAAYGIKLDSSSMSDQVKARYDAQTIVLEDAPASTPESAYRFSARTGALTENEFVRRYRQVNGPSELDSFEQRRNKGLLLGSGAMLIGGAAALTVSVIVGANQIARKDDAERALQNDRNPANDAAYEDAKKNYLIGPLFLSLFGVLAAGFGGLWFFPALSDDGDVTDHRITKFDAQLYSQRYNRALLRKTVREADERIRSLQGVASPRRDFSFRLSPFGIAGRF